MSWDGLIFRAPAGVRICDLPRDFRLESLGSQQEIRETLMGLFPDQRHTSCQSSTQGDDFFLQLNYEGPDSEGRISSIGVRSNAGDGALPALSRICKAFGARLYDNQTGDFADLDAQTRDSMRAFREFRDRNR